MIIFKILHLFVQHFVIKYIIELSKILQFYSLNLIRNNLPFPRWQFLVSNVVFLRENEPVLLSFFLGEGQTPPPPLESFPVLWHYVEIEEIKSKNMKIVTYFSIKTPLPPLSPFFSLLNFQVGGFTVWTPPGKMFWIRACWLRNISGMKTNVYKATTATAVHCTPLNGKKLLHPWCRLALNPLTIVFFF